MFLQSASNPRPYKTKLIACKIFSQGINTLCKVELFWSLLKATSLELAFQTNHGGKIKIGLLVPKETNFLKSFQKCYEYLNTYFGTLLPKGA